MNGFILSLYPITTLYRYYEEGIPSENYQITQKCMYVTLHTGFVLCHNSTILVIIGGIKKEIEVELRKSKACIPKSREGIEGCMVEG